MAAQDTPPLSRFFRLAVVTGVESAVQVHITRGDDLNARDEKGQTPLMLSAARNKAAICKLLLAAGADADLLDPYGRNALEIAQEAGAIEVARAIEAACKLQSVEQSGALPTDLGQAANDTSTIHIPSAIIGHAKVPATTPVIQSEHATFAERSVLGEGGEEFDLSGWEAEEDQAPPEGNPAVAVIAVGIQAAITEHQPIDTSANWDDFEAFLPDRATPLPRANDTEARKQLRLILLRAVREGSVPQLALEALTRSNDEEQDAEAGALLRMVVNDLGAETDERFEYSAPHESFEVFVEHDETPSEEDTVTEALAFVEDLASRYNEPLRLYLRDFQREALLTAEAEVALSQAMERGIEEALDALAAWPSGVSATLEAAHKVAKGTKPMRWMSSGTQAELREPESAPSTEIYADSADADLDIPTKREALDPEDERNPQFDLDAKESADELAEFCANAELLSGLSVGASQETPAWKACRGTLASLGLTRSFLMELADLGLVGEPKPAQAFAQAMCSYRNARDRMTVANLKLVYSIAKKYFFSGQPLEDLLQEGNIGLIKAVDRYDWRRGFKFSTYATWWIRQQIGRFVADKGKTIRLPVHIYEKTQRIGQAVHAFELRNGHAPNVEEIAALVDLPVIKVVALSRAILDPLPVHEIENLDDLIAIDTKDQYTARDPMEIVEDIQLTKSLDYLLSTLKIKEEKIVRMRYGIGVPDSLVLEEIGVRFNVTRERIRQIEAKALRKLKNPARLERLLLELGLSPSDEYEKSTDAPSDTVNDSDCDIPIAGTTTARPKQKPAKPSILGQEQWTSDENSELDALLHQARVAGLVIEDYVEDDARKLWIHTKDTPDNQSKDFIRNLISLGFEFWPGKGYWR